MTHAFALIGCENFVLRRLPSRVAPTRACAANGGGAMLLRFGARGEEPPA
jgi:hypothetical protein